ncbi:MAG: hypothetical protein GKR87_06350 [Kiritimatiellae bacterium]|nr:hypothetical protein [Kiritimatiellia bacterium]
MSTLGETLQESREAKGVTSSEAAAATRIKIQHIHDMEKDDFSHIPAPTYAKGFIKLYAEYLKLDPAPLIQEYMREHHPKKSTSVLAEEKGLDEVKKYSTKDLFKASWPPFNASIKKWGYVGGGLFFFYFSSP